MSGMRKPNARRGRQPGPDYLFAVRQRRTVQEKGFSALAGPDHFDLGLSGLGFYLQLVRKMADLGDPDRLRPDRRSALRLCGRRHCLLSLWGTLPGVQRRPGTQTFRVDHCRALPSGALAAVKCHETRLAATRSFGAERGNEKHRALRSETSRRG